MVLSIFKLIKSSANPVLVAKAGIPEASASRTGNGPPTNQEFDKNTDASLISSEAH